MQDERYKELKNLQKVVKQLNRDLDAIIVEGFSDRRVMRKLGYEGRIFESAEITTEDLAEDVGRAADRVAILTDYDNHGRKEAEEIRHFLQPKTDVIRAARKKFGEALTENDRYAVEDASPLLSSKQQKFVDAMLSRISETI